MKSLINSKLISSVVLSLLALLGLSGCETNAVKGATTLLKELKPAVKTTDGPFVVDGYQQDVSLFMARIADAVFYSDYGKSGFTLAGVQYDGYREIKSGLVDLQFAYGHRKKIDSARADAKSGIDDLEIFVSIRGSKESMDWITDLNYLSAMYDERIDRNITVHSGFLRSANLLIENESNAMIGQYSLRQLIDDNINGKRNDTFFITGHSLGGAVATLYSTKLLDRGIRNDRMTIYTYGAPPVSMDEGETKDQMHTLQMQGKQNMLMDVAINSVVGSRRTGPNHYIDRYADKIRIYRVYDSNDVVPKLIPPTRHLGIDVMYSSHVEARELLDKNKIIQIHLMKNYFDLINNAKPLNPSSKSGGLMDMLN